MRNQCKINMARFTKGNKLARGGRRPNAGRPTLAELNMKAAMLETWEQEIAKREAKLAKHYVDRAFLRTTGC